MRLLLHIGHGKTGSSYLQSWLAANTRELAQQSGLLYPMQSPDSAFRDDRASQGRFSMGNGHVLQALLESPERPRRWRRKLLNQEGLSRRQLKGLVFSFEGWAKQLDQLLPPLLPVADCWDVERIELLLMVRDPLEHAFSVYSQMVKRHGFSGSLQEWLEIYDFPKVLLHFLEVFQSQPDRISLRVDHYGHQRNNLENCLLDWLALPVHSKWQKPSSTVNRSLTQDELLIMRFLNERLGESASSVGELLVDRLPNLKPARLQPSHDALKRFEERWSPIVETINFRLSDSSQVCCTGSKIISSPAEEQDPKIICLLPEQLECLFDGLVREAAR